MGAADVPSSEVAFDLLARMTARLASTAHLDDIVGAVIDEIVQLGFGAVWLAVLDEKTGHLLTIKEVIDGVDTTHEMPKIFMLDMRQPIGHGFRERRMINIADPDALQILERGDEEVPAGKLALQRVIYDHLRGHPFACGPLLGSRGEPVGALGLSSYRGRQPIPDSVFSQGMLRAFMDHLGIAMERAVALARSERLHADLVAALTTIEQDARVKAVGELASAVAHDLNNLCGIALMAISVGSRSATHALEMLPRIERANRSIGDLVTRLQRAARPETDAKTADLRQLVDDILIMVSPTLREHAIRLEADLPVVPPVRCAPGLLQQVILNLIVNARDALAEVPVEHRLLRVSLAHEDDNVVLVVADTGPGIAPEIMPHLFQPFMTTKGKHHLGLGLAAASSSLMHFGGHLEGHTAPTGGARFVMTLATAEPGAAQPVGEPLGAAPRAGLKVLVVDDDPDIVYIIRAYLEPLGYHVTTALGADQALAAAEARSFELVLCDVGMPKRSGFDVCQTVRERGYRGKVVLMSGWDTTRLLADQRSEGCDAVLKKPFVGADLIRTLDQVLRA